MNSLTAARDEKEYSCAVFASTRLLGRKTGFRIKFVNGQTPYKLTGAVAWRVPGCGEPKKITENPKTLKGTIRS